MIHGAFNALILLFVMIIYGGIGASLVFGAKEEEKFIGVFFIAFIAVFFVVTIVFMLPQIIGGFKLYKQKPNAKTWGLIGSIMALLSFPFGTAAGVYGLWFLFGDEGKAIYDGGGQMMNRNNPPPPPNSWQQ